VETPSKGLKVLEVFEEFESRIRQLSTCDQAVLVADKVVMFLPDVDIRD
jgi:hypothetical protein